jgi:hypothetical protein
VQKACFDQAIGCSMRAVTTAGGMPTLAAGVSSGGVSQLSDKFDMEFDVVVQVVAGGGSAGCVLATRLTENPATSLCLIEIGGRDHNPWICVRVLRDRLSPRGCAPYWVA